MGRTTRVPGDGIAWIDDPGVATHRPARAWAGGSQKRERAPPCRAWTGRLTRRLALSYHSVRVQGSFCVRKASHSEPREAADVENFRKALGAWHVRRSGHVQGKIYPVHPPDAILCVTGTPS